MDLRNLLQSMTILSEAEGTVHKGTYGTSHGKEDVRDQYGHKIGKVNKGAEGKKEAPKKGRGRPKKGSDDSGEVKSYDTSTLGSVFGGGKKPNKEVGKRSVKHSLKEYIEETELAINEDGQFVTKSIPQDTTQLQQVIGPDGKPALNQPIPASAALRVANTLTSIGNSQSMAEGGEEHSVNEKAKSKAQQRFFGMVHAMQKGKKVSGASKELKGVAKDIGNKDAKDFAKTKHKGLPDHVSEEDEVSMSNPGKFSNQEYKDSLNQRYGQPDLDTSRMNKQHQDFYDRNPSFKQSGKETVSLGDRRLASKVVPAVTDTKVGRIPMNTPGGSAGRGGGMGGGTGLGGRRPGDDNRLNPLKLEAAEKKTMSRAAKGNEKYGKDGMKELAKAGRDGASEKKLDTIRKKYDKYDESIGEGNDGNLANNAKPYDKVTKGDVIAGRLGKDEMGGKKKKKVSESIVLEGAMKDLLINLHQDVHSHMGDGSMFDLKKAKNVQQAEEVLKALVKHGDEYSSLESDSQNELVNQILKHLAHEKELPFNALAGVDKQRFATRTPADLSKFRQNPATPATSNFSAPGSSMATPRTGSNGFLKTLNNSTFNEGSNMKDKQFENWERELNSLLTEGITVSHSTGQQGSPDSLSINATEHDASELMSILRNSGMEMFGGSKEQNSGYGAPMQGDEGEEEFHQGIEIAPSPEVVGDGDDMLALIKKMSGIETDSNTPGSVEVDYESEEGSEQDSGEESYNDEEDSGEEQDSEEDSGEEQDSEEDSGEEQDADKKEVDEAEVEEGNFFTGNLAKAREQGQEEADLDGDGDMEKVQEGDEMCNECGGAMYEGHTCSDEQVEEGYANEAGHEEMAQLKHMLGMGNDLHRQKGSQSTGNIQKVTMETKLMKDSTGLLQDFRKLSGIK